MEKQKQYTISLDKPVKNKNFLELNPLFAGWQSCKPGHSCGPRIRTFYIIHYVISGQGEFENDKGVHHLSAGEYFIIRPNEKTRFRADPDNPWEYVWLGFNGSLSHRFDDVPDTDKFPDSQIFLDIKYVDGIKTRIEEFFVSKLFMIYYIFFCKTEKSDIPAQISNYIANNYAENPTVEEIAKNFQLNNIYLNRIFKNRYNMTIKSYILQMKMDNAVTLLANGYSVSETASLVGYSDQFAFSKSFKKYFGRSPSKYKKT